MSDLTRTEPVEKPAVPPASLLVAVDFSLSARYALEHAVRWASRAGAEVHVVHVMDHDGAEDARGASGELAHRLRELERMVAGNLAILEKSAARPAVTYHLVSGQPASAIIALAHRIGASAIVMGSEGRSGLHRLVVGSVAAHVIRAAGRPVICVKLNAPLPAPDAPIVCPVDFSDTSRGAFDTAVTIAARFAVPIHLLHVYQAPASSSPDSPVIFPSLLRDLRTTSDAALAHLAAEAQAAGVIVTTRSQLGLPALEIVRAVRDLHAGLVIMGTHGRTCLAQLFLGSVAEKVVRAAPCPVLTVTLSSRPVTTSMAGDRAGVRA